MSICNLPEPDFTTRGEPRTTGRGINTDQQHIWVRPKRHMLLFREAQMVDGDLLIPTTPK